LRTIRVDRVDPALFGHTLEQPAQRSDPAGVDGELDLRQQRGSGELPGEVASVGAPQDRPVRAADASAVSARLSD